MLPKKKLNFNDIRHKVFVPLAMSTKIFQEKFQTWKKKKIIIPGQMLGQDRPEKTAPNVNSKRYNDHLYRPVTDGSHETISKFT